MASKSMCAEYNAFTIPGHNAIEDNILRLYDEISEQYYVEAPDNSIPREHPVGRETQVTRKEAVNNEDDEDANEDNIPLLLAEVGELYNVQNADEFPIKPNVDPNGIEACAAFEKALNSSLNDENTCKSKSCATCAKPERVENLSSFSKGQHIAMPGQHGRVFFKYKRKLASPYQHHAIVKEVLQTTGTTATLQLIHFSKTDKCIHIRETRETYDLTNDEIYIIRYKHPRYTTDQIVSRAESMLPQEDTEQKQFKTYNLFTTNCEHFATWCVVGEGESFQAQNAIHKIADGLQTLLGNGSRIAKGIIRLLLVASDDLAARLTNAINVPEIVLGGVTVVYLLYCIVMTLLYRRDYKKGHICKFCLKRKLKDLWFTFGAFGFTSIITFIIYNFVLPLLATSGIGIPVTITLILLSALLQWSIPRIRKALTSPFSIDRTKIKSLSELKTGDVVSLKYYGLKHCIIVTEVHEGSNGKGSIRGIHYGLPRLFGTREIMEEYFAVDIARAEVELYDCQHLFCHSPEKVVMRARKRVGETKWALASNRSDHFCHWAKVKKQSSGTCKHCGNGKMEEAKGTKKSSLFIEEQEVHLKSEMVSGDVIQFKDTGILVDMKHLPDQKERRFRIKMMVYNRNWRCRRKTYDIDLDKDRIFVKKYHPAHCYPMARRAQRAKALENEKGNWWTDQGFIEECIAIPVK